jgi:hypothetical protein
LPSRKVHRSRWVADSSVYTRCLASHFPSVFPLHPVHWIFIFIFYFLFLSAKPPSVVHQSVSASWIFPLSLPSFIAPWDN